MSLSPQLNKLVRLIDQSLYESKYLISNEGGSKGGGGVGERERGRHRQSERGGGRKKKKERKAKQLDCHVNSCADR